MSPDELGFGPFDDEVARHLQAAAPVTGGSSDVRVTPATHERTSTTTAPRRAFTPPPSSPVPKSSANAGAGPGSTTATPGNDHGQGGGGAGTPTPGPETHTYSSAGGSITIRFADGALSLLSTRPAAGFSEDRRDTGPTGVEVRFDDGQTEWQIRVDMVDGQLAVEITHDGGSAGS